MDAYVTAAGIADEKEGSPLPRAATRSGPPASRLILRMVVQNGGTIENAQAIAAHEPPRTTKLYDRTSDEITGRGGKDCYLSFRLTPRTDAARRSRQTQDGTCGHLISS
jgi:hypothetical protein